MLCYVFSLSKYNLVKVGGGEGGRGSLSFEGSTFFPFLLPLAQFDLK